MRILVVSDIHANFSAFEAVLKDAGSFDQVWCLGDIVGYGPEPGECINRLREFDHICLAGNHDMAVVGRAAMWDFSTDAQEIIFWSRHKLKTNELDWLTALPNTPLLAHQNITLVHASLRDPVWEYITEPDIAKANLELCDTTVCLNGHTHFPVIFRKRWDDWRILEETPRVDSPIQLDRDRMLINPGSVGQPRDEDPRAAYAIVDLEALTLTYHRVQYDVTRTQQKMKEAKFSNRLIRRLRFGQ